MADSVELDPENLQDSQLMSLPGGGSAVYDDDLSHAVAVDPGPRAQTSLADLDSGAPLRDPTNAANDMLDAKQAAIDTARINKQIDLGHPPPLTKTSQYRKLAADAVRQIAARTPGVSADLGNGGSFTSPPTADIRDLQNLAATYASQPAAAATADNSVVPSWLTRSMAAPATVGAANAVTGGKSYEDGVRDALTMNRPKGQAHAMLDFGMGDPLERDPHEVPSDIKTATDDTPPVEATYSSANEDAAKAKYADYASNKGPLAPYSKAIYDGAIEQARAKDAAAFKAAQASVAAKVSAYKASHAAAATPSAAATAQPAPALVEPAYDPKRQAPIDAYFDKQRDAHGNLSPAAQALYDKSIATPRRLDDADHRRAMEAVYAAAAARKAGHADVNFAIPDTDAAAPSVAALAAAGGGPDASASVSGGSYEDRVRAALQRPQAVGPAIVAPQVAPGQPMMAGGPAPAYSPMTAMAGVGTGVPNLLGLDPKALAALHSLSPADPTSGQMTVGPLTIQHPLARSGTVGQPPMQPRPAMPMPTKSALPPPQVVDTSGVADPNKPAVPNLLGLSPAAQAALSKTPQVNMPAQVIDTSGMTERDPYGGTVTSDGSGVAPATAAPMERKYELLAARELDKANPRRINQIESDTLSQGGPAQNEANAMSAEARAESNIYNRMGQVESSNAEEGQERELQRQRKMDDFMQSMSQQADDISKQKVDPSHFWTSQDNASKAMNVLALMAGGWMAGMNGGKNQAVDQINAAIDRDINAQKFNIENSKTKLSATQNQLGMMRQQFGDERTAESAVKLSRINSLKAFIDSERSKYQDPVFQARAAAVQAQLNIEADKLGINLHQWVNQQVVPVGGSDGTGVAPNDNYVPELKGIALSKQDADELRGSILPAYGDANSLLSQARRLRAANAQDSPEGRAQLASVQARFTTTLQEINKYKRLSGEDIKNNEQIASDFNKVLFGSGSDKTLIDMQNYLRSQRTNRIKNYGVVGGRTGYDQNGQLKIYYTQQDLPPQGGGVPTASTTGFSGLGN